ncbi:MTH938/NDUFAF3 family protein, partial [Ottowia sp.]|uniref:MTH938/NDUFAF3 family protein n=1 Tax=Ottowia sp. TaxID=1898956 RepID=UPI002C223253
GLIEAGIGVETMDTGAACRTYNILAGEGRRVVAALLVEAGTSGTSGTDRLE